MKYRLFIDDERYPTEYQMFSHNFVIVRDYDSAVEVVTKLGIPEFISFDHDLGPGKTGYDFALWLAEHVHYGDPQLPEDFEYDIHSMNPVGRDNIRTVMKRLV
jgi:hypothetical protein